MKKRKDTGTRSEFFRWNKSYWDRDHLPPDSDKAIYLENATEEFMPLMFCKFLTAKGLQSAHSLRIIAMRNKVSEEYGQMYDSFGMESCSVCAHIPVVLLINSLWGSLCFLIRMLLGKDITKVCVHGVTIGDLIYDHIIRVGKRLTIGRIVTLREIKFVLRGYIYAYMCEKKYRESPPAYFVAGDTIYLQGILVRFAYQCGARILHVATGRKTFEFEEDLAADGYCLFSIDLNRRIVENEIRKGLAPGWEDIVDVYLKKIYQGIGDWNTERAYKGKLVEERETVLEKIGIRNQKKNIFIMPHCFSDAPHCAKESLYRDYYIWYEETLKIIAKIDNVNWIVKEHPSSGAYGEENVSKNLFEKYRSDSMHWLPNEYSTAVVAMLADAVVTVRGTAGMEMSCQGIRCILAGDAYYSDMGFTFEPRSIAEYERLLANLDQVERLSDEEIELARRTMYCTFLFLEKVEDEYAALYDDAYQEWRRHPSEKEKIERECLERLMELSAQKDMRNSYYYMWGKQYDK